MSHGLMATPPCVPDPARRVGALQLGVGVRHAHLVGARCEHALHPRGRWALHQHLLLRTKRRQCALLRDSGMCILCALGWSRPFSMADTSGATVKAHSGTREG